MTMQLMEKIDVDQRQKDMSQTDPETHNVHDTKNACGDMK